MNEEKTGGQAFPTMSNAEYIPGMTLRDWFAGQALAGLCANEGIDFDENTDNLHPVYARHAYKMADAMLAERAKS